MILPNKQEFLNTSTEALANIYDMLLELQPVQLDSLEPQNTALVIIDVVNGFAKKGALQSDRIGELINPIAKLSAQCGKKGIAKIAFADYHTEKSPEFEAYPVHCLGGTYESEVVDELKEIGGYELFNKNSTNGFINEEFQAWLKQNPQITNFIVTGDCTDICISQFSTNLKAWFNQGNKKSCVIVPISMVDTYDLGLHKADIINVMALFAMQTNGVILAKDIEL